MTSSLVLLELRDSVAIVRLNRHEKLNALSREMLDDLGQAFRKLENDPNVRAVILTGAREGAFSAGTDIAELTAIDKEAASEVSRRGQTLCDQIAKCVVPVIAAVSGVAAGGGCELALACHMRIASTDAKFSLPETKIGMIPAYGGTQRLARIIGSGRALDMVLSGRTISAEEAFRIGLVNRVTDPDSLLSEAEALANEISKLAPLAIRACLEAVTRGLELPLEEGLAIEAELFSRLFATDDVREGTRAFFEKRAPSFKGR
jgi:enoyl-CoA hydratase